MTILYVIVTIAGITTSNPSAKFDDPARCAEYAYQLETRLDQLALKTTKVEVRCDTPLVS